MTLNPPPLPPRQHALLLAALLHVGMAFSVTSRVQYVDPDRAILWEAWPAHVRFWLWLAAAGLIFTAAMWSRFEIAGFFIAALMPIERAIGHVWSWVQYVVPEEPGGDSAGLALAVVWLSFVGFIGLCATIVQLPPQVVAPSES